METFYRALFPIESQIYGYKLRPFSYGHLALLRGIDNPFVSVDGEASAVDLVTALKVCSLQFPFDDLRFTKKDKFKAWWLSKNFKSFNVMALAFSKYIEMNQQIPYFWEKADRGFNLSSAPEELSTIVHLIKNGIQYEAAWNMSIGLTKWISATLQEQAGSERRFFDPIELRNLPADDLDGKSEIELFELAVKAMGKEKAEEWLKNRIINQK